MTTAVDRRLNLAQFRMEAGRDHEAVQVSEETTANLEKLTPRDSVTGPEGAWPYLRRLGPMEQGRSRFDQSDRAWL